MQAKNWLHPFLYNLSDNYRYNAELEAYADQWIEIGKPELFLKQSGNVIKYNYALPSKMTKNVVQDLLSKAEIRPYEKDQ